MEAVDLIRLKKLAGIDANKNNGDGPLSPLSAGGSDKGKYMKDHNIKPGTDEWFKLWFARPGLTGESPYKK